MAAGVVVAAIVVVLVIFLIVWLVTRPRKHHHTMPECVHDSDCPTGKTCVSSTCVTTPVCTSSPVPPQNVVITYNQTLHTATITWSPSSGATGYKVYQKLEDPSVGKSNHDVVSSTAATTITFTGLAIGTHYFVITALNTCGESDESSPVVFSPACASVPSQPPQPSVVSTADNCLTPQADETVDILIADATGPAPFNLVRSDGGCQSSSGQKGGLPYFMFDSSPSGGSLPAWLECSGSPVSFTETFISDAQFATLITPTGPIASLGTTLNVSWQAVLGAEQYAVMLISIDASGSVYFVGDTITAPETFTTIDTPIGTQLVFAQVIGYKLCDVSLPSNPGYHITPIN
uniref:Fibronectin type-III domain-containing protein n=1 Tax=viral metagenome TaxID=1070528 RepID=A0A6C0CG18_9ZZZZ